jgi:hypothetical protein
LLDLTLLGGASLGEGDVEEEKLSQRNFTILWTYVPNSHHSPSFPSRQPFRSSARTVYERELALQANGISRMDSGWI